MDRRRVALYLLATPLVLALLLFLPAGTWAWPRGWLFVLVFLLAMGLSALYLWRVNPESSPPGAASTRGPNAGTASCWPSCSRRWRRSSW